MAENSDDRGDEDKAFGFFRSISGARRANFRVSAGERLAAGRRRDRPMVGCQVYRVEMGRVDIRRIPGSEFRL